ALRMWGPAVDAQPHKKPAGDASVSKWDESRALGCRERTEVSGICPATGIRGKLLGQDQGP
ncbi:MAG: hypothetical protein ACOCSQ_04790, partial [Planctomycetota bacterium]